MTGQNCCRFAAAADPRIRFFPLLDKAYSGIERIARTIHAAYLRSERMKGYSRETNPSAVEWEALFEGNREQNRQHAVAMKSSLEGSLRRCY